jgi:hypothetical protein
MTTVYLTKREQDTHKDKNPYESLEDVAPKDLFAKAMYPYFAYYSTKGITIETIEDVSPVTEKLPQLKENEVCVILVEGFLKRFFLQTFKNNGGKFFYIDTAVATKDNESTWKILEDGINMREVKKVYFIYPHFSKLIHAYRITTIYRKEVVDVTY